MDNIRKRKQDSVFAVAMKCRVTSALVTAVEAHKVDYLPFLQWVALASYYGKAMLTIPVSVHSKEFPIAEVYFMYIRNGEPVQYAAKQAFKLLIEEE